MNDDRTEKEIIAINAEVAAQAVKYGEVYFHALDLAMSQQIKQIEGRVVQADEFEMFIRAEHWREDNPYDARKIVHRKYNWFTKIFWKEQPIVLTEFSDYFYVKKLNLKPLKGLIT